MSAITKTSARDSSPQPMRSGTATPTAVDSVESTDRTRNRAAHVAAYCRAQSAAARTKSSTPRAQGPRRRAEERGLGPASIRRYMGPIRAALVGAVEAGLIAHAPKRGTRGGPPGGGGAHRTGTPSRPEARPRPRLDKRRLSLLAIRQQSVSMSPTSAGTCFTRWDRSIGGSFCEALDARTQTTDAHVCAWSAFGAYTVVISWRRQRRWPAVPRESGRSGYGSAVNPTMEWQEC